jgi:hypothetical protein
MANILEPQDPGFVNVYQIELGDDVAGGIDGIANRQAKELVERDAYLKNTKVDKNGTDRLMTADEASKLAGIAEGAQVNPGAATTATAGLMSAVDKTKLDGVAAGATASAASSTTPKQNGTATAGEEEAFARGDHAHPNICATQASSDSSTKQASTAFVQNVRNDYRSIGDIRQYLYQPSSADMIKWRVLPLNGQWIRVADYPDLVSRFYVGNAKNASAPWWYKFTDTSDPDGSRSTAGQYIRVQDVQGLHLRAAGQNSKERMADDTPYDGGSIGAFGADRMQVIKGNTGVKFANSGASAAANSALYAAGSEVGGGGGAALYMSTVMLDSSRAARTGPETNPAYIAVYVCLAY